MTTTNETLAIPESLPALPGYSYSTVMANQSDVVILGVGVVLAALYLFKDQIFAAKPKSSIPTGPKLSNGGGDPRNFIAKMKDGVSLRGSIIAPSFMI